MLVKYLKSTELGCLKLVKISPRVSVKSDLRSESFKRKFSIIIILFACNLMIECPEMNMGYFNIIE